MTINANPPSEADCLWVVADKIRFLGNLPGSSIELLDIEVPAGSGTPPHTHESAELLYVLEGELTVRQFGAEIPPVLIHAGPGTSVRIPSRVPHNYVNESGKLVRMLVMLEASMVAFFRDIGSAEPASGPPDFGQIGAAMERHGIEALASAA
ncbi:cupin domain-containing protein [Rhizobium ruizarguesonis]|uniref:cupin domain-containing protein n=1 Tax=Rhizobium ruizarguesonis TaxID=2081791 RepID=UPI001030FC32|nr:cupin domain-containing protein [Rhizobium ruizarguesonis]TBB81086.1 cupin domain-containing protein [Rhizobium ruizarguesonis]TBC40100.1 cupin domain-containing protein [Rhizobium ruizarguesonis]